MKYLVIALSFTLLCSCQTQTKEYQPITEQEIQIAKDLIQGSFDDLWAGLDSTKISKYHTDDFIILEQGEIWDNDRIKEYIRKKLARANRPKRTNRMEYIAIDKYGESIQIAYYNFAEFTQADTLVSEAKWLESALAVSTKDGWKLKMMHSTWAGD
ncbi:hypothetical protein MATR_32370 [Marivirga tractuosa]|uniref:Secreted protein n=1 Tax=Marivirga tractuosa (strain ATCC 23168 / DSM 4126 / NBRC 15989 / NCIMB 1408 / VKM B-1430 / H-43) TaxID=643867 RepID=E4TSX3_MARTH|nr:hypothetical protein [Marivirga tractuosa]ADR22914.1 secreted protein [Marivirga tractuosa DSM 4126]BDD16412.1 hypothetical protein MATR_32370 [Marivirga tractuosa]